MNTVLSAEHLTKRLKKIEKQSNKGTNGTLTVVAGSAMFRGAASLSVGAALRTGCGLVRLISTEKVVSAVAVQHPCAIFSPVKENEKGAIAAEARCEIANVSPKTSAFLIGPGLSQSTDTAFLVGATTEFSKRTVLDADALNIISQNKELLYAFKKPFIVTPHVGEMSRLTGLTVAEIKKDPSAVAKAFSLKYGCVTVLKDHVVYISNENGEVFESRLGNEGLAKGGSGDVLSGFIAGSLARGYSAEDSAVIGTVLHGLAAEKCASEIGKTAMLPSDLEGYAVKVLRELGY